MDTLKPDTQEVATPWPLFKAVEKYFGVKFVTDLAASPDNAKCVHFYDKNVDALTIPWMNDGWNYLNPPFKGITKWVKKCAEESAKGAKIISIWPLSGDLNQLPTYMLATKIYVVHGRVWPNVRGCMIVMWNGRRRIFDKKFHGLIWDSKKSILEKAW